MCITQITVSCTLKQVQNYTFSYLVCLSCYSYNGIKSNKLCVAQLIAYFLVNYLHLEYRTFRKLSKYSCC